MPALTEHLDRLLVCPVCQCILQQAWHDWLFRCEGCGLEASTLQPEIPTDVGESQIDEAGREVGLSAVRTANNQKIVAALLRHHPARGRLLDVGSGLGFFLRAAREAGFDVVGVEPDGNVVETARSGGFDVRHGFFPDALDPAERFDVIVFNDVLEHIPDVTGAVYASAHHLSPDGLLVLNCPDRRGAIYRASAVADRFGFHAPFDRMWQRHLPSPHVWYFTSGNLVRLGEGQGLSFVEQVKLTTLSLRGLRQRIFHVRNQDRLAGFVSLAGAWALAPFLAGLPRDLALVILRKGAP